MTIYVINVLYFLIGVVGMLKSVLVINIEVYIPYNHDRLASMD